LDSSSAGGSVKWNLAMGVTVCGVRRAAPWPPSGRGDCREFQRKWWGKPPPYMLGDGRFCTNHTTEKRGAAWDGGLQSVPRPAVLDRREGMARNERLKDA